MRTVTAPDVLTPGEVAALFHVATTTVVRWAEEGKIASFRTLGGHRRFHRTDVEKLLAAQSEPARDA